MKISPKQVRKVQAGVPVRTQMDRTLALHLTTQSAVPEGMSAQINSISVVAAFCHANSVNAGWWHDLDTGAPLARNAGELLALIHSEVSEALEGHRKGLQDDHLSHRPSIEVELADAFIRICDLSEALGLDLGGAVVEKMAFNRLRADHKPENRRAAGGKRF